MSDSDVFLILEQPCDEAVAWAIRRVGEAGLQILPTFDLQAARQDPAGWPCPQHGASQCDCQMVVLLVYGDQHPPVSLVAHCQDATTWFSLVDTPQQRADPHLESAIRQALLVPAHIKYQAGGIALA